MPFRSYFLPGIAAFSCLIVSFSAPRAGNVTLTRQPVFLRDTIILVAADPSQGFNFPYYLRIPKGLNTQVKQHLLVETNNTGNNDTLAYHIRETRKQVVRNSLGSNLCEYLKVPFLMPVFPRPSTQWKLYTHALDRETMQIKSGELRRLDQQLVAMTKNAATKLSHLGISSHDKIIINGFSASGTFANRFTLLHPEAVAAVACGGINGIVTLPVSSLSGQKLDYPLGLNDIKKISGRHFNDSAYKKVPQYIYMGAKDSNDAVEYEDAYVKKERELVHSVIAKNMLPDRFEKCRTVYESSGALATFKTYPNIGHETDREVFFDVGKFFKQVIEGTPR